MRYSSHLPLAHQYICWIRSTRLFGTSVLPAGNLDKGLPLAKRDDPGCIHRKPLRPLAWRIVFEFQSDIVPSALAWRRVVDFIPPSYIRPRLSRTRHCYNCLQVAFRLTQRSEAQDRQFLNCGSGTRANMRLHNELWDGVPVEIHSVHVYPVMSRIRFRSNLLALRVLQRLRAIRRRQRPP